MLTLLDSFWTGNGSLLLSAVFAGVAVVLAAVQITHFCRNRFGEWVLVNIKGEFTDEHHLPDELPVPRSEVDRVGNGDFSFEEAVDWMSRFVKARRYHRRSGEYAQVLRKYDIYREMAAKMGKGMWQDVDRLSQRLAEIDPLDPSAAVARGRAMRELGNFAGAIRSYQRALDLTPFHSAAFPEFAATCRAIGQPGRFRAALDKARSELGDTHPLTIEGRIALGELVRVYADPTDPATLAHIPREQYVHNVQTRLEEIDLDRASCLQVGVSMLQDDMPELAENLAQRCERELGECAESLLLQGMVERYKLNTDRAESLVRKSLQLEDSGITRLELGRILQARARSGATAGEIPRLEEESRQQLRLAVDRDHNMVEAIGLLVEPAWDHGVEGVAAAIEPITKAYPGAWGPWRVLGDAYATEGLYVKAIGCYANGLKLSDADALLLPCLSAMEEANARTEMHKLARRIKKLANRDPQLRWKIAQILCDHQELDKGRKILQNLVDDERVPPQLRQRADDVLDHLDDIERQQAAKVRKKRRRSEDGH